MAKAVRTNNVYQQNIVKMLNGLAGRYSRWVIWQDFITMATVAICNSVPHPQREAREKQLIVFWLTCLTWTVLTNCIASQLYTTESVLFILKQVNAGLDMSDQTKKD